MGLLVFRFYSVYKYNVVNYILVTAHTVGMSYILYDFSRRQISGQPTRTVAVTNKFICSYFIRYYIIQTKIHTHAS